MPNLFGVDIAGDINASMGDLLLPAVVTRYTRSALSVNPTGPGTVSSSTHQARGFMESLALKFVDGTTVKAGDVAITLLGASISPTIEPGPNDRITIEGRTFTVVALLERDPAAATYLLAARGI